MLDDFISEKILNYISDNHLHTYQEIALATEVHRNTVIKHIRFYRDIKIKDVEKYLKEKILPL